MKKIGAGLLACFSLFLMFAVAGNHHVNAAGKAQNYGYVSTSRAKVKSVPKQFWGTWYMYDRNEGQYLTYKFSKNSVTVSEKLRSATTKKVKNNVQKVSGKKLIVNKFKNVKNTYTFAGKPKGINYSHAIAFYYFRVVTQNINGKQQKVLVTANPYASSSAYKFLKHQTKTVYTGKLKTYFYHVAAN